MALSLLIYEDNDMLREGLVSMVNLNHKITCIGSYPDVLNIESHVKEHRPALIFMDIDMPGMSGIEAVKKVRMIDQEVPILMLTVFDDHKHVLEAIFAGASGYLLKKHISSRLFDAIDEILEGGAPMSPNVARMVLTSMHQKPKSNPYQLTPRELEILTSLSKGNSYKLIAADLSISLDTVRTHIKKIYEKLQVHSQTEAVSKAINEKLV